MEDIVHMFDAISTVVRAASQIIRSIRSIVFLLFLALSSVIFCLREGIRISKRFLRRGLSNRFEKKLRIYYAFNVINFYKSFSNFLRILMTIKMYLLFFFLSSFYEKYSFNVRVGGRREKGKNSYIRQRGR